MKSIVLAIGLCVLCGCHHDDDSKKLSQKDADEIALAILADQLNAAQTNWTVTVQARAK